MNGQRRQNHEVLQTRGTAKKLVMVKLHDKGDVIMINRWL